MLRMRINVCTRVLLLSCHNFVIVVALHFLSKFFLIRLEADNDFNYHFEGESSFKKSTMSLTKSSKGHEK